MAREGYITSARAAGARSRTASARPHGWRPRREPSYALDPVRELVDSVLGDAEGSRRSRRPHHARRPGAARRGARGERPSGCDRARPRDRGMRAKARPCRARWSRWTRGTARSARSSAPAGTRDRGFNRALDARRQPGSAFKPFVYAAALTDGFTPAAVMDDSPVEVTDGEQVWRPVEFRRRVRRPDHAAARADALGQCRHRAAEPRGRRAAGGGAGAARGDSQPLDPVPATRARCAGGDAARAGRGVRAVRQRRAAGSSRRSCAASRRPTARCSGEPRRPSPIACSAPAEAFQLTSMLRSVVDGGTGQRLARVRA